MSAMTAPPKPPPVMRAPSSPAAVKAESSSGVVTSYRSRREMWLSRMRRRNSARSEEVSAVAAAKVRSVSSTTWRTRRRYRSASWGLTVAAKATASGISRMERPAAAWTASMTPRREAYWPSESVCGALVSAMSSTMSWASILNGTRSTAPVEKSRNSALPR